MASACRSCGANLPEGAKFCPECGTPTQAPAASERRVVSVLFADLVGFTERSDRADPEDVRRTLVPYHAMVKRELERFGGTLDKFIGDGALGVFGAPIAHEDDPQRAIRAALAILSAVEKLREVDPLIAVRVAVNTGEAIVSYGSGPQIGEAIAGDVVNTASRMQSVAPKGGVVVGEATFRAARNQFELTELPPVAVKGKAEPLLVWRVDGRRRRATEARPAGFVGRGQELSRLVELIELARAESTPRMAVIVGAPGVGKSRLVSELHLEAGAAWRQAWCMPYGEEGPFDVVASLVRSETGLDSASDPAESRERLEAFILGIEPDPEERAWLMHSLSPLLGLESPSSQEQGEIPLEEMAAAASSVIASSSSHENVLVIEDLHWAQPATIRMIETMVADLENSPTLVIGTTRPEIDEVLDRWADPPLAIEIIRLDPLSASDTNALVTEIVGGKIAENLRNSLVERSEGNPLFAIEFGRLLMERDSGAVGDIEVPASVRAVIAARLDAIPQNLRAAVQDASVIGTEFWAGALVAVDGRDESQARDQVEALEMRGLVESAGTTYAGEPAFAFSHALLREVAYERVPRRPRAHKHLATAQWMESVGGDRAQERAQAIAQHYAQAAELADAAGDRAEADAARPSAARWLLVAGDRANSLDPSTAYGLYLRARDLAPSGSRQFAELCSKLALSGRRAGILDGPKVLALYEESLEVFREIGDPLAVGQSLTRVASQLGALGDSSSATQRLDEAVALLETLPEGPELARACAYRAEEEMFAGRVEPALSWSDRALALAESHSLPDILIMALHIRGDARCSLGDSEGLRDLERALERSERENSAVDTITSENYLAEWLWAYQGAEAAMVHHEAAIEMSKRRGIISQWQYATAGLFALLFDLGLWERGLASSEELLALDPALVDGSVKSTAETFRSTFLLRLRRADEVAEPEALIDSARPLGDAQALVLALLAAAEIAAERGDGASARGYLDEFKSATLELATYYREAVLARAVALAIDIGALDLAESLVGESVGSAPLHRANLLMARAMIAEARGDLSSAAATYRDAAAAWSAVGHEAQRGLADEGARRCADGSGTGGE